MGCHYAGVTVNTTAGPGLALGSAMNSHVNVTGSAGCSSSTPDADKVDCMGPPGADRDTCLSNANCCFDQAGTAAEPRRLPDGSDVPWCFRDPSPLPPCGKSGDPCKGVHKCCSGFSCTRLVNQPAMCRAAELGSAMNSHVNVTGSVGCSSSTPDADKVDCMGPPGADRDTCLSNANCCFDQAGTAAEPRRLPDGSDVPWCFSDPSQCGKEGASCEGGRVTCCSGLRCENRATSWNFCYPIG